MDPYLHKLNYLRISEDQPSNSSNTDLNCHRVIASESGYGRIVPKSADVSAKLTNNTVLGAESGYEVMTGGTKSLPPGTVSSPIKTVHDRNVVHHDPSKQRSLGAIESFVVEGATSSSSKNQGTDYKIYERGNIIAASKFATPKQVETIVSLSCKNDAQPMVRSSQNDISEGGKYYSQYVTKTGTASPTHSLSGSSKDSQQSTSPRNSLEGVPQNYNNASPLYENLDYYGISRGTHQAPYYHQLPQHVGSPHSSFSSQDSKHSSPRASLADGAPMHYESNFRKAQPQVPPGVKYSSAPPSKEYPPYEAPPVYENIQEVHYSKPVNYEPAKPGPQVAVSSEQKVPVSVSVAKQSVNYLRTGSPVRVGATSPAAPQVLPSRTSNLPPPPPYPGTVVNTPVNQSIPTPSNTHISHSTTQNIQGNFVPNVKMNVVNSTTTGVPQLPTELVHSHLQNISYEPTIPHNPHSTSKINQSSSLQQQKLSNLNGGGDYVVMTGNNNQVAPVQLATSFQRGTSSGVANAVYVSMGPTGLVESPSTNSSQIQQNNIPVQSKMKPIGGKTLLPYNVTPPRPSVSSKKF